MDLDSWTPQDKARRLSVVVWVYFACIVGLLLVLGLGWPWYAGVLAAVGVFLLGHTITLRIVQARSRR